MKVNRYIIHIVAHNGFTILNEPFKLEIKEDNRWRFDYQITIQHFVNDPHFAVFEQLVVNVEVNTAITHHEYRQNKQKRYLLASMFLFQQQMKA
jgi:hypothetical protein